jgi:hypothetical protein
MISKKVAMKAAEKSRFGKLRATRAFPAATCEFLLNSGCRSSIFSLIIASMLKSRLTFKEAIESPDYSLMSRHRLKVAQREFYSRLDSLAV